MFRVSKRGGAERFDQFAAFTVRTQAVFAVVPRTARIASTGCRAQKDFYAAVQRLRAQGRHDCHLKITGPPPSPVTSCCSFGLSIVRFIRSANAAWLGSFSQTSITPALPLT